MLKQLYIPAAAILAVAGYLMNQVVNLPAHDHALMNLHAGAVIAGQMCWGIAMFLLIIRSDIFADDRLSYDGPAIPIFNTIKWGLVAAFLVYDAFVAERAWEWYFYSHTAML